MTKVILIIAVTYAQTLIYTQTTTDGKSSGILSAYLVLFLE